MCTFFIIFVVINVKIKKKMDLKIYATTVEQEAISQIYRLASQPHFAGAKIRIMPDTHAGAGCVIGFTANLGDKVVPNLVGVDIGCGMLVANIGKVELDLEKLDRVIRENIPNGSEVNGHGMRVPFDKMEEMVMYKNLRNLDHLQSSIGSLGGGNHFIEVDVDEEGNKYIVIHSGSRNLGQQVCKHYQNLAIEQCNDHTKEIKTEINETIARLKSEGRQKESSKAIKEIKEKYNRIDKVPTDICYLTGELRQDYLHDMKLCQEFAWQNRLEMLRRILKGMKIKNVVEQWQTVHNYIDFSDNIIRKGAIRCNAGEKVIIPLNMRDGSIIAIGKGNEDWNNSGPHGAGRLMSRREAKESLSMSDFKKTMEGIFTTCVNHGTIDESPMAYKNAQEIIDGIGDTAEVVSIIKPIYNFKATEIID